jgi:hypothetical protein
MVSDEELGDLAVQGLANELREGADLCFSEEDFGFFDEILVEIDGCANGI